MKGIVIDGGLKFEVEILDTRKVYGQTDYLCRPVAGEGETWKRNIKIIEEVN